MKRVLMAIAWMIVGVIILSLLARLPAVNSFVQQFFPRAGGGGDDQPPIIVSDGSVKFLTTGTWKQDGSDGYNFHSEARGKAMPAATFDVEIAGAPTCTALLNGQVVTVVGANLLSTNKDQYQVDGLGNSGQVRVRSLLRTSQGTISTDLHTLEFIPSAVLDRPFWAMRSLTVDNSNSCAFDKTRPSFVLIQALQ